MYKLYIFITPCSIYVANFILHIMCYKANALFFTFLFYRFLLDIKELLNEILSKFFTYLLQSSRTTLLVIHMYLTRQVVCMTHQFTSTTHQVIFTTHRATYMSRCLNMPQLLWTPASRELD